MMNAVLVRTAPLEDERRRQLVYGGDLLVFESVEPMRSFAASPMP